MEARERPRAIFSTANGKYAYRETRRWVRPIFREDLCFRGDVEQMAQSLRQGFPQECKLMTAAEAFHVENYFDAVDIQMQTQVFLYEVLMRIVVYNFEEARERVQEYVNHVYLDPVRYERLTVDDSEFDCFTEAEKDLVGYDNTLPAALTILKHRKFPQVFNKATELYPSGSQRPLATHHGLDSPDNGGTNASKLRPSDHSQKSGPPLPAATPNTSQPNMYGREESRQVEHYQKSPNHMSRRASHPSDPNLVSGPPLAKTAYFEATKSGDEAASRGSPSSLSNPLQPLLLKQASAEPPVRSHGDLMVAGRQDNPGLSRTESKDHPVDPVSVPHPPIYRGQGINESWHSKGIQIPGKRKSDDVRQQSILVDVHPIPLYPPQAQKMPPLALPFQPPRMHRIANDPPVRVQMRLAGSWSVFGPKPNQRSSIDVAFRDNLPPFVPYYPRPEYRHAHPGTGEIPSHYVTISGNSLQPRIVTNPFPPTILEDSQGERNSVDQAASPFPPGHRNLGISQQPAINQQLSLKSSQLSLSSRPNIGPHNYVEYGSKPGSFSHEEGESIAPLPSRHQKVKQSPTQNSHRDRRTSDLEQPQKYYYCYPSFDQEQPPVQPREDCILFVSGFPEHLDVKAVWHMLSPVQGLRWIAPLKTANNERKQVFTNLIFHDPSFATDALRLLPRTHFTAMNGNVLTVRRFNADRAGLLKHWTTNSSSRSGHPIHRARRSSEPASSEHSQKSFDRNSRPQNCSPTSRTAQCVQDGKDAAFNDSDMNIGCPFIPETEKASNELLQDGEIKAVQISLACDPFLDNAKTQPSKYHSSKVSISAPKAGPATASTCSPIKRVKRKENSTPKTNGKGKPKDHTKAPQNQVPSDEATTLELGLETPIDEVIEAPNNWSVQIKLVPQSGVAKSVPKTEKLTIEEPETHSTHWSSDDRMRNSMDKMNLSTGPSTDHVPQMKVPLGEAFIHVKGKKKLHPPPITLKDTLSRSEATSSLQNRPTHLSTETMVLQQHHSKDEDVVRQTSPAATSHARSIDTHEQQLAAEASQRQFVAGLVQTQPRVNGSKQRGKSYRSITSTKAEERQSLVKAQVAERNSDITPQPNETLVASGPQNPTPQRSLNSYPSSTTKKAQHLQPMEPSPVSRFPKVHRSRVTADEVLSRPAIDKPSERRASSSANTTLSPESTITSRMTENSGHTQDCHASITLTEAQKADKCNKTSADGGPDAACLQNKLETNNIKCNDVLQPLGAESHQFFPHSSRNLLVLPHVQPLSTEGQETKVSVLVTSRNESKELPYVEQRETPDSGPDMTALNHQPDPEIADTQRENSGWSATHPKSLTEKQSRPKSRTSSDRPGLDTSENSYGSPDREIRSPLPLKCSPVTQNTTVAPILTRKKKQKKIPGTTVTSKELEIPYETRVDESEQRSEEDLVPIVHIKFEKEMSPANTDSNSSFNPLQSAESSIESSDTIKASPKNENEDVEASKSTSTHSPLFVTPPTTPHSEDSPLVKQSSIAVSPSVDSRTENVKDIPISKSKNRKKNRPGKKKPKCVGKSAVDQVPSASAPIGANGPTLSSELRLPDNKLFLNSCSNELLPEQRALCTAEQSTIDNDESEIKHGHETEVEEPLAESSIKNNSPDLHEHDANQTLYLLENNPSTANCGMDLGSPRSWTPSGDMFPLLRIARDAGYQHATGSLPLFIPDKRGMALVGGSLDSALVMELRSRCSTAAIKRIQGFEELEEQTQESFCSRTLIQSSDNSQLKSNMACSDVVLRKEYQDDSDGDDSAPPTYEELDGLDRAVALEGELQLVVRNAVQMVCSLATDKHELENGVLYTHDSTRAKQILRIADFHEISPVTLGHPRDSRWVKEWCDEVALWLHHAVPRMTEAQKNAMYEWAKANPSIEQNLMALGFSAAEITQYGLIEIFRTQKNCATSTQGKQESHGSRPRRETAIDKPESPILVQPSRNADGGSKTQVSCATTSTNSESDPFNIPSEDIEMVKREPRSVIEAENTDAGKSFRPTEEAHSAQADNRHEGESTQPGSNLPISENSNREEPHMVETEHNIKPREHTLLLDEKKKDLTFEDEKARLQGKFPGLSFASVDGIVSFDSLGSATLKTVSNQVSIAAAIKRNEQDLQGKSSVRRYKKVDQTELNTLGLTSSPLAVTTDHPSILPTPNTSTSSSALDTAASPTMTTEPVVQSMPNASEVSPPLTPKKEIPTSTTYNTTVRTSSTDLPFPRILTTTKLSYANALQSPTSKSKPPSRDSLSPKCIHGTTPRASGAKSTEHTETDAWSLLEEDAWGSATKKDAVKRSESL